jgi:phospholipase C
VHPESGPNIHARSGIAILTRTLRNLSGITNEADYILPYYISFLGEEDAHNRSQCTCAGANNWQQTTEIMNFGKDPIFSKWAQIDTVQSMAYFKRPDNPFYWALAEAYEIADNYHVCTLVSLIAPDD